MVADKKNEKGILDRFPLPDLEDRSLGELWLTSDNSITSAAHVTYIKTMMIPAMKRIMDNMDKTDTTFRAADGHVWGVLYADGDPQQLPGLMECVDLFRAIHVNVIKLPTNSTGVVQPLDRSPLFRMLKLHCGTEARKRYAQEEFMLSMFRQQAAMWKTKRYANDYYDEMIDWVSRLPSMCKDIMCADRIKTGWYLSGLMPRKPTAGNPYHVDIEKIMNHCVRWADHAITQAARQHYLELATGTLRDRMKEFGILEDQKFNGATVTRADSDPYKHSERDNKPLNQQYAVILTHPNIIKQWNDKKEEKIRQLQEAEARKQARKQQQQQRLQAQAAKRLAKANERARKETTRSSKEIGSAKKEKRW